MGAGVREGDRDTGGPEPGPEPPLPFPGLGTEALTEPDRSGEKAEP